MIDLKGKKIHFLGVGGVGVNALAKFAVECGGIVSGSDLKLGRWTKDIVDLGGKVVVSGSENALALAGGADMLVFSSAVKENDMELRLAREMDIPVFERHEFLGNIASGFQNVVGVAGTHGKTTTTAMLAHILFHSGQKFCAMIGGDCVEFSNYVNNSGGNELFVTEACEYRRNFLSLKPTLAVVLNVECDHPDCYRNIGEVRSAFDEYLAGAKDRLFAISPGDDICAAQLEGRESAEYRLKRNRVLLKNGQEMCAINLQGGEYNLKNAMFAIAAADNLGVDIEKAAHLLESFKGVKRRFELAGKIGSMSVVFDFAHHPTEIECALSQGGKSGKMLVVFQPHTYSRTKAYFDDFVRVLGAYGDALLLMPTYGARESLDEDFEVESLKIAIQKKFPKKPVTVLGKGKIAKFVENCKGFDIAMFVGAGDIYDLKDMLKYDF